MTRKVANALIWLALTAEVEGEVFLGKWETPLTTVGTLLFRPVLHIVPWDALVLLTLWAARRGQSSQNLRVMAGSIKLTFASLAVMWLWGVVRGGSAYQTIFQLHPLILGLFVAMLVAATCRRLAHVEALGKVVVAASIYRAFVCIAFYLLVARNLQEPPAYLTGHSDSALWVGGLFVLAASAAETRTRRSVVWFCSAAVPILVAIVLNNRRLAWVGVGGGMVLMYILLRKGRVKQSVNRALIALAPFLALYVAIGWGHPEGIFKPVGSISTMVGKNQDSSSVMRDIENYNLLRTLQSNPVLGYGWGREYIEEAVAYDISTIFPQYRYMPHNSLLGLIAFTGMLGFWGTWQVVGVSAFLHARVYRIASSSIARTAAFACLVGILLIELQMWGDVGLNDQMICVMLALTIGLAERLPLLADVWPRRVPANEAAS